jgi:predicted RND superfamily exporter protein
MCANFDLTGLNKIKTQSSEIFELMLKDWKAIKEEYDNIYDCIIPTDDNIDGDILKNVGEVTEFIDDADASFNSLVSELNTYIQQTILNEQNALKELEEFDEELSKLSEETDEMLSRINSIGVGEIDGLNSISFNSTFDDGIEMLNETEVLDTLIIDNGPRGNA